MADLFADQLPPLGPLAQLSDQVITSRDGENLSGPSLAAATYQTGPNPRGAWSSVNSYAPGDLVLYSGVTYMAIQAVGLTATPPSSDTGNWMRFNQPLNVRTCGATGNGTTDDSAAFAAAIAVCTNLYIPPGTYLVAGQVFGGAGGWNVVGGGSGNTALKIKTGNTVGVQLAGTYTGTLPAITVTQFCTNNTLRGFTIDISGLANSSSVYGLNTVASFNNTITDVQVKPVAGASTQRTYRADNATYTTDCYSCNFGSTTGIIDLQGHNVSDAVTTMGFYGCSFGSCIANAAVTVAFFKPTIQGSYNAYVLSNLIGFTSIGGDIETTGTYLSIGASVNTVVSMGNAFSGTSAYLSGTISSGFVLLDEFGGVPFQLQMATNAGLTFNGPMVQQNTDNSAIRNQLLSTGAVNLDTQIQNSHGAIYIGEDSSGNAYIDNRAGGKTTLQRVGSDMLGIDASNNLVLGTTTAASATAGTNGAVPAQVSGYLVVAGGKKIPYFNT